MNNVKAKPIIIGSPSRVIIERPNAVSNIPAILALKGINSIMGIVTAMQMQIPAITYIIIPSVNKVNRGFRLRSTKRAVFLHLLSAVESLSFLNDRLIKN